MPKTGIIDRATLFNSIDLLRLRIPDGASQAWKDGYAAALLDVYDEAYCQPGCDLIEEFNKRYPGYGVLPRECIERTLRGLGEPAGEQP